MADLRASEFTGRQPCHRETGITGRYQMLSKRDAQQT